MGRLRAHTYKIDGAPRLSLGPVPGFFARECPRWRTQGAHAIAQVFHRHARYATRQNSLWLVWLAVLFFFFLQDTRRRSVASSVARTSRNCRKKLVGIYPDTQRLRYSAAREISKVGRRGPAAAFLHPSSALLLPSLSRCVLRSHPFAARRRTIL